MQTSPLQRTVKAADLPLDQLLHNHTVPESERLQAAGRAFEAVFLRQILESAQKTVVTSGLTPESSSTAIYRDLINTTLADSIAKSGQFGLARSFEKEWDPKSKTNTPTDPESPPNSPQPSSAEVTLHPLHHSAQLKPYLHASNRKPYVHESRAAKSH